MELIECSLGLDLGTSSIKCILLSADGAVLASASEDYSFDSPEPGWAETDPQVWVEAARRAIRHVTGAVPNTRVVTIGLDGQMHGAVLVRADGAPVRPAMLWPDTRAEGQLSRWDRLSEELRANLANPLAAGMAGPMTAWVQENEPEAFASAAHLLSPKDWFRSRFVPGSVTYDPSDASATLLWDVVKNEPSPELWDALGVPDRLLAEIRPSRHIAGYLSPDKAREWNLPPGIPITVGCADVAGTLLGVNGDTNTLTMTVGTGAQLLLPSQDPAPTTAPRFHTYRAADDTYYAMGACMNAGLALNRARILLGATWDELYSSLAGEIRPSSCRFLPNFSGERLPHPRGGSHASWRGLGLNTDRSELLRTAIEGVVYGLRQSIEMMPAGIETVDLLGGGTADPLFQQLIANVLGREVRARKLTNITSIGAARLGWSAVGADVIEVDEEPARIVVPEPSPVLDERYSAYLEWLDEVV